MNPEDPRGYKSLRGDHHARQGDDGRGSQREPVRDDASLALEAGHEPPGVHREEPDADEDRREPDAEGDDEEEPEADAPEGDRAQEDDERRRARNDPARHAQRHEFPERYRAARPVIVMGVRAMPVIVGVMMSMGVGLPRASVPPEDERHAQDRDREARGDPEPRVQPLRDDVARGIERHHPQQVDACRMRGGHDESQHEGVPGGPAGTDEVRSDDCLAVAGLQSVEGAEAGGDDQGEEDDPEPKLLSGDELGESVPWGPLLVRLELERLRAASGLDGHGIGGDRGPRHLAGRDGLSSRWPLGHRGRRRRGGGRHAGLRARERIVATAGRC